MSISSGKVNQCKLEYEICCPKSQIQKEEDFTPPRPLPTPTTTAQPTPEPVKSGCGFRNPEGLPGPPRKLKHNESKFGEFPWMMGVFDLKPSKPVYLCGGSLIHPQVVLTAAQCVIKKKTYQVRAGEWDIREEIDSYKKQDIEVQTVVTHPLFFSGSLFNDIAVLFLKTPVQLEPHIGILCLPPNNLRNLSKTDCIANGFGKDSPGRDGAYSPVVKRVQLDLVPRKKCEESLRKTRLKSSFELHRSFICAGGKEEVDTCYGDGGGPLACPILGHENRYYQAGIVSWGEGCGERDIPGVYTKVSLFKKWILREMAIRKLELSEI